MTADERYGQQGGQQGVLPPGSRPVDRREERLGVSAATRRDRSRPATSGRERLSADYDEDVSVRRREVRGFAGGGALSFLLGHDPATRKLVMGAVGIGGVLLAAVGGWSLMGSHHAGIPIIGPPPGPLKDRPTDPGGMQIMGGDGADTDTTGTGEAHLAPAPERPDPTALARQYGVSPDAAHTVPSARPSTQPEAPPSGQALATSVVSPGTGASLPRTRETGSTAVGKPDAMPQDAAPKAPSPQEAARSAASRSVSSHPPPHPAARPASHAPSAPSATDGTHSLPPPVPEPDTARHVPVAGEAERARSIAGNREVQLAALGSETAARAEWEKLKAQAPTVFAGRVPSFETTTRGDRTFVRLRIGGFADFKAARAFCVRLHAESIACTPAQF